MTSGADREVPGRNIAGVRQAKGLRRSAELTGTPIMISGRPAARGGPRMPCTGHRLFVGGAGPTAFPPAGAAFSARESD
jgi:hypothetical protein